jgi:hypothetical protein
MRYFLSKAAPRFSRVLLIESGSRSLFERLLPVLYNSNPGMRADLVTCFAGNPAQFREDLGNVYRVTDYPTPESRNRLYSSLKANQYDTIGIICAAEPIMTKWKWMLGYRVPGKIFVVNENGDYFYFDRANLNTIRHFVVFRAGLSGAGAVRTLTRVALFPFTLLYLLLFAATHHLRRKLRTL